MVCLQNRFKDCLKKKFITIFLLLYNLCQQLLVTTQCYLLLEFSGVLTVPPVQTSLTALLVSF